MGIFLIFLTIILILVSLFMGLVILMQRASSNAGMGQTLGGGAAESAFGGETGNVLTRATIWSTVIFLVLCFVLYLGYLRMETTVATPKGPTVSGVTQADIPLPAANTLVPGAEVQGAPSATAPQAQVETPAPAAPEKAETPAK